MNIAILTSNHNRHKYFVNQIARRFNSVAVVSEEKSFAPLNYANDKIGKDLISEHFSLRDRQENEDFDDEFCSDLDIFNVNKKNINSCEVFKYLRSRSIDYIFVYGTGIIGKNIIKLYPNRIINMHLGLSPYYRGSGTNFWPIVNAEPEYCGVTIHFLDEGIDTGDLICRGRAKAKSDDTIHSFGNKIIKIGTKLICDSIDRINTQTFKPLKQDLTSGKTYYRKDFNSKALVQAYKNINDGLFRHYEKNQYELLKGVPIYEIV